MLGMSQGSQRLQSCLFHRVGTAPTHPSQGWMSSATSISEEKNPTAWHCASSLQDAPVSSSRKNKRLFLVSQMWSLYTSNLNTASPGKEGTSQGTWSCWLCPRVVGMAVAWHHHTVAPAHGRGQKKPPGCTRVRSPHWSRRWCPCHPSGTRTGTRSSGWRLPTWQTRCSCWAPVCCKESKGKEIIETCLLVAAAFHHGTNKSKMVYLNVFDYEDRLFLYALTSLMNEKDAWFYSSAGR